MKIRMKTVSAGPTGVLLAGCVYDVDPKEGKTLVAGGYAEAVEPEAKAGGKGAKGNKNGAETGDSAGSGAGDVDGGEGVSAD